MNVVVLPPKPQPVDNRFTALRRHALVASLAQDCLDLAKREVSGQLGPGEMSEALHALGRNVASRLTRARLVKDPEQARWVLGEVLSALRDGFTGPAVEAVLQGEVDTDVLAHVRAQGDRMRAQIDRALDHIVEV